MDTALLATKVRVPPQPHRLVHRPRLIDALERGIPLYKLIHISAPAGYGKTTLLSQWVHSSQHFPAAWLSISQEDNDPERFLRYLLKAWEAVQPGVMKTKLGWLLGSMMPEREAVLSAFINVASDISDHTVFVLDDYHLIEDPTIHEMLTFLFDHLPSSLHFVLVGRGEPPLLLARYRARRELLEFRAEDLQFVPEETNAFLIDAMGLDLAPADVATLQAQMEGWIAGLQLAALSLRRHQESTGNLVISGRHRFIADYLSQDVFDPLPNEWQEFMLKTSILDHLCAPLCDAVTGRRDSQAILEALERENLFLVPLDDRREWFRYHQLYANFLNEVLHRQYPEQIPMLHRQAAHWYLDHDLPEQAFHHARDGEDIELVMQIFDCFLNAKLNGGEFRVVERWIRSLPPDWYAAYPVLGLARVGYLAYTGAFEVCMRQINEVEQMLTPAESESTRWQMSRVIAVRCLLACFANNLVEAEKYANQALKELPEDDLGFRPGIYVALGDAYRQQGHWGAAKSSYHSALSITNSDQSRFMSVHVYGALADLELRQGRLRNANGYWRKALAVIHELESWGRLPLSVIGWVYIRISELLYEWNQLPESREYLLQGLERAELGGDIRALIAGYLIAGRLELTEGDAEAAVGYLEQARPLVENAQFSHWVSRFERFQLELWLAQDMLWAAVNWSDDMLRNTAIADRPEREIAQLTMARALVMKGDMQSTERALTLLKHLLKTAGEDGRIGIIIEASALQALALWRRGEQVDALIALEQALRLAEPEGYVRLFADLGLPMARLLQEARSRILLPGYVTTLLQALGAELPSPARSALLEPLTPRERETLELIAAGLTNREIAGKLVISPETVKKHTGSIYGKLSASNRTEAVARARELGILD